MSFSQETSNGAMKPSRELAGIFQFQGDVGGGSGEEGVVLVQGVCVGICEIFYGFCPVCFFGVCVGVGCVSGGRGCCGSKDGCCAEGGCFF